MTLFINLAEMGDKEKNYERASKAYDEALEIFKEAGIIQYIKGTEKNIEILNEICSEGEK